MMGGGFTLTDNLGGSIRVKYSTRDVSRTVQKGRGVTAGGLIREQIAGSRIIISEKAFAMTESEYNSLIEFLSNEAISWVKYESDDRPAQIPAGSWPLTVAPGDVTKTRQVKTAEGISYYLEMSFTSVELVRVQ